MTLKRGFHRLGSQQYIPSPLPKSVSIACSEQEASPTGHHTALHDALSTEVHLIEGGSEGPDCKVTCFAGLLAGLIRKCRPGGRGAENEEEPQLSAEERRSMDLLTQIDA